MAITNCFSLDFAKFIIEIIIFDNKLIIDIDFFRYAKLNLKKFYIFLTFITIFLFFINIIIIRLS